MIFFGFGVIAAQFFGETSDNLSFNENRNFAEVNNTDLIPQGKFKYEIFFAEFGVRMPNGTCNIKEI